MIRLKTHLKTVERLWRHLGDAHEGTVRADEERALIRQASVLHAGGKPSQAANQARTAWAGTQKSGLHGIHLMAHTLSLHS